MAKDAHVAVPRLRRIGAVGLVALVIVAGLAWFLIKDHGKSAQSAAAVPATPAPAVAPSEGLMAFSVSSTFASSLSDNRTERA